MGEKVKGEKSPDGQAVEVLILKRLIYDLVIWADLPKTPFGWECAGLRRRVDEALADLPPNRTREEILHDQETYYSSLRTPKTSLSG